MDTFKQHGDRLLKTLTGTVKSGDPDVVGTGLLGVAMNDGLNGETIDYAVEGVFEIPKVSAAVIARGDSVLWDASAAAVDDNAAIPAAGDFLCGYAWEAAGAGVLVIDVKLARAIPAVT